MKPLLVLIVFLQATAMISAQTAIPPLVGNGSPEDPYYITSLSHLYWIVADDETVPNPNSAHRRSSHYIQTIDIDASDTENWFEGLGWPHISNPRFTGSYNGQSYMIDSLYSQRDVNSLGLFGFTQDSTLSNIRLTNVQINGSFNVGGLVGRSINCIILNSYVSGNVGGISSVGGIAGSLDDSILENSHASANITAESNFGGLVGLFYSNSTLLNSYYNIDSVEINGQNKITLGGIFEDYYDSWVNNNLYLNIDDYLSTDAGGNHLISDYEDFRHLMFFGQNEDRSYVLNQSIFFPYNSYLYVPYFTGIFEGSNHTLYSFNIQNPSVYYVGLFGITKNAHLKNLNLVNTDVSGFAYVGSLTGEASNSIIENCHTSGTVLVYSHCGGGLAGQANHTSLIVNSSSFSNVMGVDCNDDPTSSRLGILVGRNRLNSEITSSFSYGTVTGAFFIGGLAGVNEGAAINHSFSNATVNGLVNSTGGLAGKSKGFVYYADDVFYDAEILKSFSGGSVSGVSAVGGLVGTLGSSSIQQSYSNTNVSGNTSTGGFVGFVSSQSDISDCFSTGSVNGEENVGGLVGKGFGTPLHRTEIVNCFSTGLVSGINLTGGLVGDSTSIDVHNSYWNIETSNQETSPLGEGRSTGEMTYPYADNTYYNWDFSEVWGEDINQEFNSGYPFHRWYEDIYTAPENPYHTLNPIPDHWSEEVSVDTPIGWTYQGHADFLEPDGFLVQIWDCDIHGDPHEFWFEGGTGDHIQDTFPLSLDYDKTYYWQVIPYVEINEILYFALHCPIWTFTTEEKMDTEETGVEFFTKLTGNFPNPFNPSTHIAFSLEKSATVRITIYNIRGQRVYSFEDYFDKGNHSIIWKGKNDSGKQAGSGVYFYKMDAGNYNAIRKMLLLK